MNNYNNKEVIFSIWDELIYLLENLEVVTDNKELINEIKCSQILKKKSWEQYHERKEWKSINKSSLIIQQSNILKTIILKWEELIIEAYFYLQIARKQGGTFGHKIGPIWSFHKQEKEKYENLILKLLVY